MWTPRVRDERGLPREGDAREVARLALPALATLVAEPLFLLADSAVVGRLGTLPLAALGLAGAALASAASLCVFLAYATTASVARLLGAGREREALREGVDGLWLALVIGGAVAVLGQPAAPALVRLLGADEGTAGPAATYLRVGLLGLPGMLVVLAATGVLRGSRDTRTPLVVGLAGAVVNTALNVVLVHPAGLGLVGSAVGTAVTQTAMALALAAPVLRRARSAGVGLRLRLSGLRRAGAAGLPLLVRTVTLRLALLLTTWVAAGLGPAPLAASQVAFAVWSLLAMGSDALAVAAQALVAGALGAGDAARAGALTARLVGLGALVGVGLGVLVLAVRPAYVPLATPVPAVRHELAAALLVVALLQPLAAVVFVLDGVLIGGADGRYLAGAGLVTLAAYAPAAWAVHLAHGGLVALWLAFGVFLVARAATLVPRWRATLR
ncbi:putative MATE family efflux protein [Motilibacter rhizosphaerae]|uniref:Putative MATE family efflux protein n=1 Tax=Motilibacter rhizosphaerae TaxID=598652 RepID=A0A4Q7NVG1_9ACTN|nr:MATE family efflux transporter [Motilibacter rhizosphaerae]RZS91155.1 putative MATE family efflux protein [Motilibacter rhizosphaerae]